MEHGSKRITFYVKKHIAALAMCFNPGPVREKLLGAPASVNLVEFLPPYVILHTNRGPCLTWNFRHNGVSRLSLPLNPLLLIFLLYSDIHISTQRYLMMFYILVFEALEISDVNWNTLTCT